MRQQVAITVLATASVALSGCSLIYNPSNLADPNQDGPGTVDAEIIVDADPSSLTLTGVAPMVLLEGTGVGGSRRAVLTIHGTNFVPEATVQVTSHDGSPAAKIMVDNSLPDKLAGNNKLLAVPITVMVDNTLAGDAQIRLDVSVTQPTPTGDKTVELTELSNGDPVLILQGLPELTAAADQQIAGGDYTYSQVMITGSVDVTGTAPLRITSTSSINISGAVRANTTGRVAVAGGADGGTAGSAGIPAGAGGPGADAGPDGGGDASGGGGGHAGPGGGSSGGKAYGTDAMHTLFGGSGGAGGNGSTTASGGAGGGGGGVVELTAHGNLSVGSVEAKGANGATGNNDDGGGGAGGSILVRSFGTLASGALAVDGGAMGLNPGSAGRARYDAAMGPAMIGGAYRGPMFNPTTPLITRTVRPTLSITGKPLEQFSYFWENEDGSMISGPFDSSIASNGTNMITFPEDLYRGTNRVCLLVKGAELSNTNREARNCIQLVYLLPQ